MIEQRSAVFDHSQESLRYRPLAQGTIVMKLADELRRPVPTGCPRVSESSSAIDPKLPDALEMGGTISPVARREADRSPGPSTSVANCSDPGSNVPCHGAAEWRCGLFWKFSWLPSPPHAAAHHDFKSLSSFPGIRLPARPLQLRFQEHRDRRASTPGVEGHLFPLPPASARL